MNRITLRIPKRERGVGRKHDAVDLSVSGAVLEGAKTRAVHAERLLDDAVQVGQLDLLDGRRDAVGGDDAVELGAELFQNFRVLQGFVDAERDGVSCGITSSNQKCYCKEDVSIGITNV